MKKNEKFSNFVSYILALFDTKYIEPRDFVA